MALDGLDISNQSRIVLPFELTVDVNPDHEDKPAVAVGPAVLENVSPLIPDL